MMKSNLKPYIKAKIKILGELGIVLLPSERDHLSELQNEIQIDNYAHDLIFRGNASPWDCSFDNHPTKYSAPVRQSRAMRF